MNKVANAGIIHKTNNRPTISTPLQGENASTTQNYYAAKEVWLDGQDVKQWLHISDRMLQTWRDEGYLPYSKVIGKIYYKESDVRKLLERHMVRKTK